MTARMINDQQSFEQGASPIAGRSREMKRRVWSIAVLMGDSPLSLSPPRQVTNPVLTHKHVTDVPARFVADPFMVREGDRWWMFFEVLHITRGCGEIGLATSVDALRWEYRGIVFRRPFHLSYPCVFSWQNDYYMLPETIGLGGIELYRAHRFPVEWRRAARLVQGVFADPTAFFYEGRWWMFACSAPRAHDTLCLFQAPDLLGPWTEHPCSPIVLGDPRRARPAGRVTRWNGKLLRFAQDCVPAYGTGVRAFEILELTPRSYRELELAEGPILSRGETWNQGGMHHIDPHPASGGGCIACVDGDCPKRKPAYVGPPPTSLLSTG
jgi:hypothetical protein